MNGQPRGRPILHPRKPIVDPTPVGNEEFSGDWWPYDDRSPNGSESPDGGWPEMGNSNRSEDAYFSASDYSRGMDSVVFFVVAFYGITSGSKASNGRAGDGT